MSLQIDELETTKAANEATITKLESENKTNAEDLKELEELLTFYDENIVFTAGYEKYYHSLNCEDMKNKYYLAFNVEQAKSKGFASCPKCQK